MDLSVLIFFGMAFALVFLLRVARIGTLLAFLLAGVLAGQHALGLFELTDIWRFLGQLGIIFLWFSMGLELNMKRLWQMKHNIFGFGAAQVIVVACMLFPILYGFTVWSILGTVMVALMLAMSSTSSDLGILADRNELQSQMGRQTFSILLFQDLMSIPLLAMLPVFAGFSLNLGANIIDVIVMSVGLILGIVIVGRLVLNPLMRYVTKLRSKEAFLLAIMLNIVLWAVVFEFIGMPPAMGAFMAGMLLSETVYRHQIQTDVEPYQMLFLAFFFIALGMGLDVSLLLHNWWMVILGAVGLVVIKFGAIYMVARVRRVMNREAFIIALILAQGGEFGLLILQTMKSSGIEPIPYAHGEILMAIIIISMMLTPILLAAYDRLYQSGKLFSAAGAKKINMPVGAIQKPEVIICGFGRVGKTIAKMLQCQNIPYVAIDMNVDMVMSGREEGFDVFYGDTTKPAILKEFGLAPRRRQAVVIALDNAAIAKKTVRAARNIVPKVRIFARARNLTEANILHNEGAKMALPETIESSFMLGEQILLDQGVQQHEVELLMSRLRGNNYETLNNILDRDK
ncbi:MAG: cation:proton antiporter [Rickettsiales bacterium]|jgi:Kef-type K+ transport system membrane component KefB/voltage-gated potassium channel Kch|nr:cation:proton antiporter [Rickettsiales bacterium]